MDLKDKKWGSFDGVFLGLRYEKNLGIGGFFPLQIGISWDIEWFMVIHAIKILKEVETHAVKMDSRLEKKHDIHGINHKEWMFIDILRIIYGKIMIHWELT